MRALSPQQLINGQWTSSGTEVFSALNPATHNPLPESFFEATEAELNSAVAVAGEAFEILQEYGYSERAALLDCIADKLAAHQAVIVQRAMQETGLPEGRLNGEMGRTCHQLRMFAGVLRAGDWLHLALDSALPERQPPRPDIRLMPVPLGPVAVFGASNFPLAFSTAGGDTASALAAGCPVIVKGHPAHPGTAALVAEVIAEALAESEMPAGCFALLQGRSPALSQKLVAHPGIKAVGFTGSLKVGRLLFDIACQRPEPIPFYGELGSSNPVFLLSHALALRGAVIAQDFVASLTLGCGQFCTNPGLLIAVKGEALEQLKAQLQELIPAQPWQTMLTPAIAANYEQQLASLKLQQGVAVLAEARPGHPDQSHGHACILHTSARDWLANPHLEEEIFGPCSLLVECDSHKQMLQVARRLSGHLTATLQGETADQQEAQPLVRILMNRVGRLLYNGYPTGVEVCHGMQHGGPYPAATDSRSTSVGANAIQRFVRPVCLQNLPDGLLPVALKTSNPLNTSRTVDGQLKVTD
ncbi:hypothetical protein WH50_09110 [Pokkaliibacter plantistimulans]|uniref:Aldehyde dehydrogenase domain-containing protein n=1 Tax=Pokkaliibacter plantistimulans TaxID=1635171 RepID=A0ABX5M1H7_9GAMM|nr:aldehyde dehydrogenase (NADP(+)) [Pokkaliibacter plantistimulans]PXF31583.1 hypothetical protein WH50_09110 [Pokkaliibacter plantistimulans]